MTPITAPSRVLPAANALMAGSRSSAQASGSGARDASDISATMTGILVVLEVIPRSAFTEAGVKVLAVVGIALVATLALGLLTRP